RSNNTRPAVYIIFYYTFTFTSFSTICFTIYFTIYFRFFRLKHSDNTDLCCCCCCWISVNCGCSRDLLHLQETPKNRPTRQV
ncbi:hypothetical protein ABG768_001610, partial [Culter alburnus]